MPLTDADKDTKTLLGEIKAGIPANLTAIIAKVTELQYREIASGDSDYDAKVDGGTRPHHAPSV